jgi:hypothetical protein
MLPRISPRNFMTQAGRRQLLKAPAVLVENNDVILENGEEE